MAQEFVIKSPDIEDKINQLLPSQGGFQAGVDFSASTMVVPVIDLTETAEGSNVRPDLQTALSFKKQTTNYLQNVTNTTLINTTGYYRLLGHFIIIANAVQNLNLFDGSSSKQLLNTTHSTTSATTPIFIPFDFNIFLEAGDSLRATSTGTASAIQITTRQIATIDGNLVNP